MKKYPRKPMPNSTSRLFSPSENTLAFVRSFARIYSPEKDNECEARRLSAILAAQATAKC